MARMDSELRRFQQEKYEQQSCDPMTLVAVTREKLYDAVHGGGELEEAVPWIEETLTRFDQQARATIGAATFSGIKTPSGQSS